MPASPVDCLAETAEAGRRVLANEVLHLRPSSFDRIEVRAIGRKKKNGCPDAFDELSNLLVLVCIEVVHANDMAGPQDRHELFLDKPAKLS